MKPTLIHHPTDYFLREVLVAFAYKRPMTSNVLYRLEHLRQFLSARGLDFLLNYYLDPSKKLDRATLLRLEKRLSELLRDKNAHVELPPLTAKFMKELRKLAPIQHITTTEELIYHHGNQFLTGAPFFQGGIAHTLFFQWGNLFGVAKYVDLEEERALESNVLIHFESVHERTFEQCIKDYQHKNWLQHPMHPVPVPKPVHINTLQEVAKLQHVATPNIAQTLAPTLRPAPIPQVNRTQATPQVSSTAPRLRYTYSSQDQTDQSK